MKSSKLLLICTAVFALTISLFANARVDSRMGILPLDITQRQQAILAAPAGRDASVPSEMPQVPIVTEVEVIPLGQEDKPEPSKLVEEANEALDPVSLDERIQRQAIKTEITQFGYALFNKPAISFAPAETLPVPGDYVVVPGDTFTVQVFGATDVQYRLVVTRDGRLLVPEVGAISVAGLTFDESKLAIQSQISKVRIGVKTVVTLSDLQTIQVVVMGEVIKPGTFTVPGMTNLFNALVNTGGIKTSGSLRKIELRRQNQLVTKLDLYEMLLSGKARNNPFLQQGDVIFVPTLGPTVTVAGEVNRPAIYELLQSPNVQTVIAMAGGLLPTADPSKTQIRRLKDGKSYTLLQVDLAHNGAELMVKNGDQIRLFPALNRMDNIVVLSGNTITPGAYEWKKGMRVADLLNDVQLLRQRTDFKAAVLVRERRNSRRVSVQYMDLGRALDEPSSFDNLQLQPRDELIVFDTHSSRERVLNDTLKFMRLQATVEEPADIIEMKGYFKHGGSYPLERGKRLLDMIRVAGGVQDGTDLNYAVLVRRTPLSNRIEPIALSLVKALASPQGDHNPTLQAGDRIYLFDTKSDRDKLLSDEVETLIKQARYDEPATVVQINGKSRQVGQFPLTPGMTVKDLIDAAGGLTEEAYGQTAVLTRQVQMADEFLRAEHIEINIFGKNQILPDFGMRLQAKDRLTIREKPESEGFSKWVTVKGEVRYPGRYAIGRRETLCELIRRVGGLTQDAYVFGAVFLRESVRKREQDAINRLFGELDNLLAEVHTSPSFDNDKKLPIQQQASDVYKVIKSLKPQKAMGRMVIDAPAALARCEEQADIVLEAEDQLIIPKLTDEVTVIGQVYFPTSHKFRDDRGAMDYINLSGGTKELAQREHAYVVQANGEVISLRGPMSTWGWFLGAGNSKVTPGATIYIPLSIDRINGREYTQSWIDAIYKAAVSAASLTFLFK